MQRSVQAKRVLRRLYRSGRLARLERTELRLFLLILAEMSKPSRRRRWHPNTLRQALGLSETALNRAAVGLEKRGWLRIVRAPRSWGIELQPIRARR